MLPILQAALFPSLFATYLSTLFLQTTLLHTIINNMVAFTFAAITTAVVFFAQTVVAVPSPGVDASGVYVKRAASCSFPTPSKTVSLSSPKTVSGTFDGESPSICAFKVRHLITPTLGGLVRYDRGKGACSGQKEGGDKDAVFLLESGATLK